MRVTRRNAPRSRSWEIAAAAGCDMALLERNLKLTPTQRVEAHQQALALVRALRQAQVVRRG